MATISPAIAIRTGPQQSEWWSFGGVGVVLAMLLVPLPHVCLDLLLALHFAGALVLFFAVLMLEDALEFASFPSVLLIAALFRTALAIAVMRAILTTGSGGQLVEAAGSFILGGSFIVGIVLFLTLIIVQFAVVTGGANRIAEVAARFTLDALPGKQMSIDADLSAGVITEDEARRRRDELSRSADFYAAMDGAGKFVRGDTITALLVGALCFLGGLGVGVFQLGMDWQEAAKMFALLTVGQGLLIQVPALLASAASGFIVTRSASEGSLSSAVFEEAKSRLDAWMIASGVPLLLGLMPGMPKVPLFLLTAGLALGVWHLRRQAEVSEPDEETAETPAVDDFAAYVHVDPVELEVGFALVPMATQAEGGKLLERITNLRRKLVDELGLIVPPIRVKDNLLLGPNNYAINIRGATVAEAECHPHRLLAVGAPGMPELEGFATTDPSFGLPAYWIDPEKKQDAEQARYTVVDAETALITHIGEVAKHHGPDIMSRQEVQDMLDQVSATHPAVVEEVVPQQLSRGEIHQVLSNLLAEGVPIKDLVAILESAADGARVSKDLDFLTERVRRRLARTICQPLTDADGALAAVAIDPETERRLTEVIQDTDSGCVLVPDPSLWQSLTEELAQAAEVAAAEGAQPVVVCGSALRLPLRRLLSRSVERLPVLSFEEVNTASVALQTKAIIGGNEQ